MRDKLEESCIYHIACHACKAVFAKRSVLLLMRAKQYVQVLACHQQCVQVVMHATQYLQDLAMLVSSFDCRNDVVLY